MGFPSVRSDGGICCSLLRERNAPGRAHRGELISLKTRGVMRKQPRRIDMPIAKSSHDSLAAPGGQIINEVEMYVHTVDVPSTCTYICTRTCTSYSWLARWETCRNLHLQRAHIICMK